MIETITEGSQVAISVLLNILGVDHSAEAGFQVADHSIYPAKVSQIHGIGAINDHWLARCQLRGWVAPRSSRCAARAAAMAGRPMRPASMSRVCAPVPQPCCVTSEIAGRLITTGTGCGPWRYGKTPIATERTTASRSWPLSVAYPSMPCGSKGSGRSPRASLAWPTTSRDRSG